MKVTKTKLFLASMLIGAITTSGTVISSGFTPVNIRDWVINGLFVAAIAGFLGVKIFPVDDSPKRKR